MLDLRLVWRSALSRNREVWKGFAGRAGFPGRNQRLFSPEFQLLALPWFLVLVVRCPWLASCLLTLRSCIDRQVGCLHCVCDGLPPAKMTICWRLFRPGQQSRPCFATAQKSQRGMSADLCSRRAGIRNEQELHQISNPRLLQSSGLGRAAFTVQSSRHATTPGRTQISLPGERGTS